MKICYILIFSVDLALNQFRLLNEITGCVSFYWAYYTYREIVPKKAYFYLM